MPGQSLVILASAAVVTLLIYLVSSVVRRRGLKKKLVGIGTVHVRPVSTPDHTEALDLTGPIAFAPALAAAWLLAGRHLPRNSYPYRAVSAEDIDARGLASTWEILFAIPNGMAIITVRPGDQDAVDGPMVGEVRTSEGVLPEDRPPLPERPIDSPVAISALCAQGCDLTSSTRGVNLVASHDESGRPVWRTEIMNARFETPLAA